jgi:hypothetical protein
VDGQKIQLQNSSQTQSIPDLSPTPTPKIIATTIESTTTKENIGKSTPEQCHDLGHETVGYYDSEEWMLIYLGTLGEEDIGLTMIFFDNNITGEFYYFDELIDYPLFGCLGSGTSLSFSIYSPENSENQDKLFSFSGNFETESAEPVIVDNILRRTYIAGDLLDERNNTSNDLFVSQHRSQYGTLENKYLSAGTFDDEMIESTAVSLQIAVRDNNKEYIANLILYPIDVHSDNGTIEIKTKDEFLANYEKIFHDGLKEIIQNAVPHHMFNKYSGIMLGAGEIWFNNKGKIISILY